MSWGASSGSGSPVNDETARDAGVASFACDATPHHRAFLRRNPFRTRLADGVQAFSQAHCTVLGQPSRTTAPEYHPRSRERPDSVTVHGSRIRSRTRPRIRLRLRGDSANPYHARASFLPGVNSMRSHFCGTVTEHFVGKSVALCGWVHRRRDHGGVIFIDLRDRSGIVQVVYDPDTVEAFATAEQVRPEYVLRAVGRVRERPRGHRQPGDGHWRRRGSRREPGGPEHRAHTAVSARRGGGRRGDAAALQVCRSAPPRDVHAASRARARIARAIREFLDAEGFIDIETPMLTRATPEGARDYLGAEPHPPRAASSRCRSRRRSSSSF